MDPSIPSNIILDENGDTLFDELRNFILDETGVTSVGGTIKFYPPSEKPRGIPIARKSKIHKRPREKGIEYNL